MRMACIPILFVWLTGCFLSCRYQRDVSPLLYQAEIQMESRPDSAAQILRKVESPEKLPEEKYAVWCLLMTQAMDESNEPHLSDTYISFAVDYYDRQHDQDRKAVSLYYKGRVNQDLGQGELALISYFSAFRLACIRKDYRLCGMVCDQIRKLYEQQYVNISLFPEIQQSYAYYGRASHYQDSFLFYVDSINNLMPKEGELVPFQKKDKYIPDQPTFHAAFSLEEMYYSIATGILMLLVASFFYWKWRQKRERDALQKERDIMHYKELATQYKEYIESESKLPDPVDENNEREKIETLRRLLLDQSLIYRTIIPYIGKLRRDKQDENLSFDAAEWDLFLSVMDNAYDGFLSRLKTDFEMDTDDLIMASLIKLTIIPSNMRIILNIHSPSLITRKKAKLAERLHIKLFVLEEFLQKYSC